MKNIEIKNNTKCKVECQVIDDTTTRIVINDEYVPKDGDFVRTKRGSILIFKKLGNANKCRRYASFAFGHLAIGGEDSKWCGYIYDIDGPATPEEIQLLTDKLEEQGKRWNAKKKVIEDLPKEPKVGEMCIFWNSEKPYAHCAILREIDTKRGRSYTDKCGDDYRNCIPFESIEQYKNLIKE